LILACVGISIGGAVFYLSKTPKIYTATGAIEVLPEAQRVLGDVKSFNPEVSSSVEAVKTVENNLMSPSLMLRVVQVNELQKTHPRFQADSKTGRPLSEGELASGMAAKVEAKQKRGSRTIEVNVDDTDPKMAAQLVSSIMQEFINSRDEQQVGTQGEAVKDLMKKLADLDKERQDSEIELQKFREKNNTTDIDKNENQLKTRIEDLGKQFTVAKARRISLEGDLPILKHRSELTVEQLLALSSVANQPDIQEAQKKIITADAEFASAKRVYLEKHPKFQRASSAITDLKLSLEKAVRQAATMVSNNYDAAKETEEKLQKELTELEKSHIELKGISIPYRMLADKVETTQKTRAALNERIDQLKIASGVAARNVVISTPPVVPDIPSKPSKVKILALALAAGLGLAATLIVLLKAFDNTILSIDQAETELGLPVLAAVPQAKGKAAKTQLVIADLPASREAEAFRCLRTAVSLANSDGTQKVILFTSAVPAEGKSYCSSNYAAALAQQGLRTLLIDCDLRRPALGRVFPSKKEANGITDFLTGKSKFDECWHVTEVSKLYFMPAGTKNANPAELLSGEVVAKILKEASRKFDRVIIDSAPVNAVSDTLLLAEHVDAVVFVVRARSTPVRATMRALQQLQQANGTPYGVVLNRLPTRGANYYYYDEGSYHSKGVYGA
jgi:polysaccharide biosynthesis transport protein